MTTTHDLIKAIASGDAVSIETAFQGAMAEKIATKLDDMRMNIAQNMFNKPAEQAPAAEPAPTEA